MKNIFNNNIDISKQFSVFLIKQLATFAQIRIGNRCPECGGILVNNVCEYCGLSLNEYKKEISRIIRETMNIIQLRYNIRLWQDISSKELIRLIEKTTHIVDVLDPKSMMELEPELEKVYYTIFPILIKALRNEKIPLDEIRVAVDNVWNLSKKNSKLRKISSILVFPSLTKKVATKLRNKTRFSEALIYYLRSIISSLFMELPEETNFVFIHSVPVTAIDMKLMDLNNDGIDELLLISSLMPGSPESYIMAIDLGGEPLRLPIKKAKMVIPLYGNFNGSKYMYAMWENPQYLDIKLVSIKNAPEVIHRLSGTFVDAIDLNNDGLTEIIVFNSRNRSHISIIKGKEKKEIYTGRIYGYSFCDIDKDGILEILIATNRNIMKINLDSKIPETLTNYIPIPNSLYLFPVNYDEYCTMVVNGYNLYGLTYDGILYPLQNNVLLAAPIHAKGKTYIFAINTELEAMIYDHDFGEWTNLKKAFLDMETVKLILKTSAIQLPDNVANPRYSYISSDIDGDKIDELIISHNKGITGIKIYIE